MTHDPRFGSILVALALLSGCARGVDGDVPSLAKRPNELNAEQIAALVNAPLTLQPGDDGEGDGPAPALPPATADRMETALSQHHAGNSAFFRQLPATRGAIAAARGAAVDSEDWVVAQMVLSRLDSARAPSVAALGALDALYAQTVSALGVHNARLLSDARRQVAFDVADQNQTVALLGGQLRY